jgi:hypothetical protein
LCQDDNHVISLENLLSTPWIGNWTKSTTISERYQPATYGSALQQNITQIRALDGSQGSVTMPLSAANPTDRIAAPTITLEQRKIIVFRIPQAPCSPANDVQQHINSAFASAQ